MSRSQYTLLLPVLVVLLACARWISGAGNEPAPSIPEKAPTTVATLPPQPVATSFARFEAANLRAAATSTMISRMDCGPDPRKCVGVMTIPVGCIRSCEGQVLHLRRPDFVGYVGECMIHGQACVTALNTPFVPNQHYLTFVYRNDSGDLWGAFELWPQEIR